MSKLRAAIQFLYFESAFGFAYDAWVGSTYLSGLAGKHGMGIGLVTLLTAVPFIGQVGQLYGFWAFKRIDSLKRHTVILSGIARGLWLIPLVAALWLGARTYFIGVVFPTRAWFFLVTGVACLSSLCAASSAISWMAWTRELIPQRIRGRVFGVRQGYAMMALILANLVASFWVSWQPGGYRVGFWIIGLVAVLAGGLSSYLLSRMPDVTVPVDRVEGAARVSPWASMLRPLRDTRFRRVLLALAAFNCAIQVTGPFFPYYFTKDAGMSISAVAICAMLGNLGNLVASGYWGRKLDSPDFTRRILFLTANGVALSPLFYAFLDPSSVKFYAPFDYLVSGMVASGYGLASTTLIFSFCPRSKSAAYFSVYLGVAGLFGAVGTFAGGALAHWLVAWGGFRSLWWIGSLLRFAVVWTLFRALLRDSSAADARPVAIDAAAGASS